LGEGSSKPRFGFSQKALKVILIPWKGGLGLGENWRPYPFLNFSNLKPGRLN